MAKRFGLVAIILIAAGAILGGLFGRTPFSAAASDTVTSARVLSDYREAVSIIDANYVSPVDHEKITESSVQGMLWTLDPHSSFFSKDEFRKLQEEQSSEFYGIGVSILQHRDGVYVQSIIPNTPADKAGLRYGDRFLTIDGKDARDWSSAEVSKNVRGEKGTPVKITVERVGAASPISLEIVRGGVPLPSIRNYFMLPNGVGYVGLTGGFQETTVAELDEAVGNLRKQGMKSLILDLRGNPGGILEQAVEVVSRFIPQGKTVVSVKGRSSYTQTRELLSEGGEVDDFPLVVMINAGSASASEIVSGALQDYGRAVLVGTDSFGKGLVQRIYPLPFSTAVTLTTARYYTPFGRSLQRDYSNGSIYQYYVHEQDDDSADSNAPVPVGSPITTPNGRTLYGGRGIEPDVKVPALKLTPLRSRLNEAAFYFTRQLAAGKIAGFESMKVDRQNFNPSLSPGDLQISDKLFDAFKTFTVADPKSGLTAENIGSQADYAKTRIRLELATANYSNEAGVQVLLETDPQVAKAVEVMPQAARALQTVAYSRPVK
jgi:carboxyl-terminal processing protease